jgi:hypothetical protein
MLLVAACEGYTESGSRGRGHQTMSGGELSVSINKAHGPATRGVETGTSGLILVSAATPTRAKGSYKIRLLGADHQLTLTLEARNGRTVQGSGWMVTDGPHDARYRVTAVAAEDAEYAIAYAFE